MALHSLWHKFWDESWARAWGYAKVLVGGVGAGASYAGTLINDGSVKSAIDSLHLDPKIMLALAILGAVTILSAPKNA